MDAEPIIGGVFGIEIASNSSPCFHLSGPHLAMVNARSCLKVLLEQLRPGTVWFPSYFCESLLAAVERDHLIRFFPIDENLTPTAVDELEFKPGDLVVTIAYFGFRTAQQLHREARRQGAWILEDACQAFLLPAVGTTVDFSLYSPRKFVGTPDGGLLLAHTGAGLPETDLSAPETTWWLQSLEVLIQRREFDRRGGERPWFELFREVEGNQPTGPFRMSDLTMSLLKGGFDWRQVARQRRSNYRLLAARLGEVALLPELPSEVVPLGFPIRVKNRDRVREQLFEEQIFPPIHWELPDQVAHRFPASRRLSKEILTIPCDHRYTGRQMQRVADTLITAIQEQTGQIP